MSETCTYGGICKAKYLQYQRKRVQQAVPSWPNATWFTFPPASHAPAHSKAAERVICSGKSRVGLHCTVFVFGGVEAAGPVGTSGAAFFEEVWCLLCFILRDSPAMGLVCHSDPVLSRISLGQWVQSYLFFKLGLYLLIISLIFYQVYVCETVLLSSLWRFLRILILEHVFFCFFYINTEPRSG